MREPSAAQLEYLDGLRIEARMSILQLGDISTAADASAAIEILLKAIPLRPKTRAAIFAALKDNKAWTPEVLKKHIGIESFASGSDASEWHGREAMDLLSGRKRFREHEVPAEPKSFVDLLAQMNDEELARMSESQPNGARIIDPPAPQPTPTPTRRRGRPASYPVVQPVVDPAPAVVGETPKRRVPGRPMSEVKHVYRGEMTSRFYQPRKPVEADEIPDDVIGYQPVMQSQDDISLKFAGMFGATFGRVS